MKTKIYRLIYALPLAYLAIKLAMKAVAATLRGDVSPTVLIDTDGSDIG